MNDWTMFDLGPGKMLKVARKYVCVYSYAQRRYWYYFLNGKCIGSATEKQMRLNPDGFIIFGDCFVWVKRGQSWRMLDYEGNDVFEGFIKNVTFSDTIKLDILDYDPIDPKKVLPSKCYKYLTLKINDNEMSIYAIDGEPLLEKECCKSIIVYEDLALITTLDNNMMMFDLREKSFIGGCYADIKSLGETLVLKTIDKCYLFDPISRNIVGEINAQLVEKIDWNNTVTFSSRLYRNSNRYLESSVYEDDEEACETIVYNGIKVKKGDILWIREKFFAVTKDPITQDDKRSHYKKMVMCYTLEGRFIGKTTVITNDYDEISNFSCYEFENYLVLKPRWAENWRIYDFEAKKSLPSIFTSVFSDWCKDYLICNAPCSSQHEKSIMYIFSLKSKKLLFKLDGYKKIGRILGNCFKVEGFNNEACIFDEKGEKIFDLENPNFISEMYGMILEDAKYGTNVYDCVNRKKHFLHAYFDPLREQYARKISVAFYDGKRGLYAYSDEKGFYELVPIRYDFIQFTDDYILAQISLGLIVDVYDFDGRLISSTGLKNK